MTPYLGLLRTAPLLGETTSSLIYRVASRYGMQAKVMRACWKWRNYPPVPRAEAHGPTPRCC